MYPYAKNAEELRANIEEAIRDATDLAPDGMVARLTPRFFSCDYPQKSVCLEYPSEPWMRNPAGGMHGGMIATVFDNAMCTAVRGFAGIGDSPTVNLQISYIRPVRIGVPVRIRVRVSGLGRTIAHVSAELWQGEAETRVLASASSTVFVAVR
ncbi:PaaI family thioesterase [Hominifimenecus sp. rT4P-3]|uniref:PaaI family thioesterase n=1 Tax=Hominifimenecus sp. rT4P-3 TaxID=3242979 RepID=UPI003DA58450